MDTFLFTDIESSTRLWEEHPEEMAVALARHDAILTGTIENSRGKVLKTTGDGVIAVFDTVDDALAAALVAQRALHAEPWVNIGELRVRMGVHAGEPEGRTGDYFGPTMNRAARIMAAAHGGQILVSATAAQLAQGRLPDGAALRDLGSHRLKDLTEPEHLYQLVQADIDRDFPQPRSLDARPHNLPLQTTEFLGRSQELTAIQVLLESPNTRLLTVTGPGGAGKTRLALQVAAEELERFPDGVYFVDLSAERDSEAAFAAVVRALDLPMSGGGDPLQLLKSRLRDQKMLLVLDNFEQVTEAASGVVELLQHAHGLEVIVTSRETLRVRAERVFPVPPLGLPDPKGGRDEIVASEAVQLFVDRARAVNPEFAVGAEDAATIAEICLRLEGLPLAIELAAARLNVFTPGDLLTRLRERLDVLGAGGRDLPDRQRTLWGAIGWSYELLDDTERHLFEMMSVFAGARLPALEALAKSVLGMHDVLDPLGSLVDKSLVRTDQSGGSQRFSMLMMIKEFAAERLAENPEKEDEVHQAHALYYCDFAHGLSDGLTGPEREATLGELEAEIGNLRVAWRHLVERNDVRRVLDLLDVLSSLHEVKGWYHGAIDLARDALGVLDSAEPSPELDAAELALRTSLARATMAVHGFGPEVEESFAEVLRLAEERGTAADQYPVLRALAAYHMNVTRYEEAMALGKRLIELGEKEGDEAVVVDGRYIVGVSTLFMGDLQTGFAALDWVIERYDPKIHVTKKFRLGPNTGVAARVASGLMLWQAGELDTAVDRVGDALRLAREIDHPYSVAYGLYHNGFLALDRYRFEEARETALELARVAEDNEYLLWRTLATVLQGVAETMLGNVEEGLEMTETGIVLYQGLSAPPIFWPLILSLRAMVHAVAGAPRRAVELIDEAVGPDMPEELIAPEFRVLRGDFLMMLPEPDPEQAEAEYLSASETATAWGMRLIALRALTRLVQLRRSLGTSPDGSEQLAAIYDTFTSGHEEQYLVEARKVLEEGAET